MRRMHGIVAVVGLLLSGALLNGVMTSASVAAEEAASEPQVITAIFHADWCGTCKKMGPAVMDTQARYADKPVLFVKFDLTNKKTTNQSALLASALGIGDTFKANQKTGFALLLDGKTKEVVGKLTVDQSAQQMGATIDNRLAGK